jgi:hypothetical protein
VGAPPANTPPIFTSGSTASAADVRAGLRNVPTRAYEPSSPRGIRLAPRLSTHETREEEILPHALFGRHGAETWSRAGDHLLACSGWSYTIDALSIPKLQGGFQMECS